MATVSIDVDLPPGVTITAYERQGNGHGFEVSWPWPDCCRCDQCRQEERAYIEVKDSVQVVRDLDLWGQPSFWIYQTAFQRCPSCGHRQHLSPPFKRRDVAYTYRFEQQVLRLLIGSNETEVGRRLGVSAETVALIVRNQLADAKAKEVDPQRVVTDVGIDELSLKKRHKLYVAILTDLTDPQRPEVLAVAQGRDEARPGRHAVARAAAAGTDLPGGHGPGVEQRLSGPTAQRPGRDRPLPRRQEIQRGHRRPAEKKSPGRTRRS